MNDLKEKVSNLIKDFEYYVKLSSDLEAKEKELKIFQEELESREMIVKKETTIARDRKIVLDARENNIENKEARLQRLSQA